MLMSQQQRQLSKSIWMKLLTPEKDKKSEKFFSDAFPLK